MRAARLFLASSLVTVAWWPATGLPLDFFLDAEAPGVYVLAREDLPGNGTGPILFSEISLTRAGEPLSYWIEDLDGDERFSPGDRIEFLVPAPTPDLENVEEFPVRLSFGSEEPVPPGTKPAPAPADNGAGEGQLKLAVMAEEDRIRTGFALPNFTEIDFSFWARLSSLDEQPLSLSPPAELKLAAADQASLVVSLRGATSLPKARQELPEHALVFDTGEKKLTHEWSGRDEQKIEIRDLDLSGASTASIRLQVPARFTSEGDFVADVAFLDWAYWEAPLDSERLAEASTVLPLLADSVSDSGGARIAIPPGDDPFAAYSASGKRWEFPPGGGSFVIDCEEGERLLLVRRSLRRTPATIRASEGFDLARLAVPGTDYLLIASRTLEEGARRLARFHEERGWSTAIVTTEEIADSFGYGFLHPEAIRAAIGYWYGQRPEKEALCVLLLGDASPEKPGTGRNLIPTYSLLIDGTLCASDNPYACHSGDDWKPELAIGRLPVASLAELEIWTAKRDARLAEESGKAGGSPRSLWITDHYPGNQKIVASLSESLKSDAVAPETVIPESGESNAARVARIKGAISEGRDWILFHGHGGRHVWRTGAADYAEETSIFDSDDVGEIGGWPSRVVFGSSCDNAPFDHPADDSLGERFVLAPGGGSLCFVGASWRVVGSALLLREWVSALERSATVGEAFLETKRNLEDPRLLASYNLLGDPAIPSGGKGEAGERKRGK